MRHPADAWRRVAPIAALAGAVLVFFRDLVLTDRTFYFRDMTSFVYPTRRLIRELLWEGHLPLWNPYLSSGVPLWANVETNVLYPLSLVYYVLPFVTAFKAFVIGHFLIAGVGMYALGRGWGFGRGPALFGGVAFMLSGPLVSLTSVVNFLPGLAWLPLALWTFDRALRTRSAGATVGASAILALQASTDPQTVYFAVVAMGLYGLVMLRPPWGRSLGGTAALLGGIGALAGLLAAAQLVPLAELYRESVRAGGIPSAEATRWSFRLLRLAELILPRLFGDPAAYTYWPGMTRGEWTPWLLSPYLGIPTLVLAGLATVTRWRQRAVWFLMALFALSGTLALGDATPVHRLASELLPFYRAFRFPEKWWLLATFAVAGLAAVGLDTLGRRETWRRERVTLALVAMVSGLVVLAGGVLVRRRPELLLWLAPVLPPGDPTVLVPFLLRRASLQGAQTAALLIGSGLILTLPEWRGVPPRAVKVALLLVLLVDLTLSHQRLVPLAPAALHQSPSPLAEPLRADPALFRVLAIRSDWEQVSAEGGAQSSVEQYHQWLVESLYPNTGLRYRLHEHDGVTSARLADHDTLQRRFARSGRSLDHWSLWNVKYVISLREFGPPLELVMVAPLRPSVRLYRNPNVFPRAWVVSRARGFADRETLLAHMTGREFDPRREVLLEEPGLAVTGIAPADGQVEVLHYGPNEVGLEVSVAAGGYLVLADTFYPGWRATVDGVSQPVLRANYAMRAVRLEPGVHRVRFLFHPWSVGVGAAISLAALVGVAVFARRRGLRWHGAGSRAS